jgi:hypothetical protein
LTHSKQPNSCQNGGIIPPKNGKIGFLYSKNLICSFAMANENNKDNKEMMMVNGLIKFLSMRSNFMHKIHKKG